MNLRFVSVLLLTAPVLLFAGVTGTSESDFPYVKVENRVFREKSVEAVRACYTNGFALADFQNALVDYRLGNMTTNVAPVRRCLALLSNSLLTGTNVFLITYYGVGFSSVAMLSPDFFEKLPALGRSFELLDRAVELYPGHYMPHFYRSMMKLMAPSIVGGDEQTGLRDMEFVLSNMGGIRRDGDYRAFIHFFYAVYWGDMKKNYDRADEFLLNARRAAKSDDMISNINVYRKKYGEKRGKAS